MCSVSSHDPSFRPLQSCFAIRSRAHGVFTDHALIPSKTSCGEMGNRRFLRQRMNALYCVLVFLVLLQMATIA